MRVERAMRLRWLVVGTLLVSACGGSSGTGTDGGAGTGGGGGGTTGAAGTGSAGTGTTGAAGTTGGGAGTTGAGGTGPTVDTDGPFTCTPSTQELVPEAGATGARLCFHPTYTGGVTAPPVLTALSCVLQTAPCPSTDIQVLGFDIRTGLGYARTATNDPPTTIRSSSHGEVSHPNVVYWQVTNIPLDTDVTIVIPPSAYWTAGYGYDDFTVKARFVGTTVKDVVVTRTPAPAGTDGGGQ